MRRRKLREMDRYIRTILKKTKMKKKEEEEEGCLEREKVESDISKADSGEKMRRDIGFIKGSAIMRGRR